MRPRLLSFHAVEALLDRAFPQARQRMKKRRAQRRSEIEIPTGVRPNLTVSVALSELNQALMATEPTIREKPPDRSGVVRAVSKKNATWIAWVVRIPAAVALGVLFGTLIAIFLYGDDILFRDMEATVDAPPRPPPELPPAGPPTPVMVAVSPAPEAVPPPVKKSEKVRRHHVVVAEVAAPAVTASTSKDKGKDTKVPTPARLEARAAPTPIPTPIAVDKTPAPTNTGADDKAVKREKALAEAARKLAEGQLSQSLSR